MEDSPGFVETQQPHNDLYDSPWRNILNYFDAFLEFYFPDIFGAVDWSKGFDSLDGDLLKVIPSKDGKKRQVDRLMKVWLNTGKELVILLHVEVQATYEASLYDRVYWYNIALQVRYQTQEVISLVVLADAKRHWIPKPYTYQRFGNERCFNFASYKILAQDSNQDALMAHENPFALVTLAQIFALKTRKDSKPRQIAKKKLLRLLIKKANFDHEKIRGLFDFINWVLYISDTINTSLVHEVDKECGGQLMPYQNQWVREGIEKGRIEGKIEGKIEGIAANLKSFILARFKTIPQTVEHKIANESNPSVLSAWSTQLFEGKQLHEVFG